MMEFGTCKFFMSLIDICNCIPWYARHYVLEKLYFDEMDKMDERTTYLKMKHGFIFKATINNHVGHTCFACANWRVLCKAYGFEVGMSITFDIGIVPQYDPVTFPQYDQDIWVDLDMIPILSPSYFLSPRKARNTLDETYYTVGSELTWEEKNYLISFVNVVQSFKGTYGAGRNTTRYMPPVHKLSDTNISTKCMIRFFTIVVVVPTLMDVQGEMKIICHEKTNFKYRYSTDRGPDGCLKIEGWRQIVNKCRLEIGDRWISVLHHGDGGVFLFFSIFPKREE
ncbi:hypothetical protein VPH35_137989 [Triticum aestivum]